MEAFWDSSALVPLCILDPTTDRLQSLADRFLPIVWWGSAIEISSAVARRYRAGQLSNVNQKIALTLLASLEIRWHEIAPSDEVRNQAQALLHRYPLRAAESLQLAAAMIWCRQKPAGRNLISSDTRLCDAAAQAGFTVTRPGIRAS